MTDSEIKNMKTSVLLFYKHLYEVSPEAGLPISQEQKEELVAIDNELKDREFKHRVDMETHKIITGSNNGW